MTNPLVPVRRGPPGPPGPPGAPGTTINGGRSLYLSNKNGAEPDYKGLDVVPDSDPEDQMTAVGITNVSGEVLLQGPNAPSAWVTIQGVPGLAVVDGGTWTIKQFAFATTGNGETKIRWKLFKVTNDLVTETLLFSWADSGALSNSIPSAPETIEAVRQSIDLDITDRLVLKAYAITTSTTPVDVAVYHSGTEHYSRLLTPIMVSIVFSNSVPTPLGSAAVGTEQAAAHGDHAHAHGNQAGGVLHAEVVASGAAGFMRGDDKAKVDAITVANIPTANEKAALVGTSGTAPSASNKLVDNADSRLTNTRTPTTHASTHISTGSDAIPIAVPSGASGLLSGAWAALLNAATSAATALALVLRDASGRAKVANPSASDDIDTLGARNTAITNAFDTSEAVSGASPATTARGIVDVVISFRVVGAAVVELVAYDMPATGASVAIFADLQSFTEGTHANHQVHVIVASGKRTSSGTSSRTSPSQGGGSGQVVNDFAPTRPVLSVSDPNNNVSPNVQHRLALLYTGKSGVNTIVMGTARVLIGRVT
jgi:hypothetical protein